MDAELKAKWIEALRSGKYEQGKGQLKNNLGQYCCLGVLCVIQGADLDGKPPTCGGDRYGDYSFPESVHSPGLSGSPVEHEDSYRSILATMNDSAEASFSEIADWIEANFPAKALTA